MVIRPWLNLLTGGHGHVICMGNLEDFLSTKILQKATQICTKVHFFLYKQISGRNGDHGWFRMTNAFILCALLWNVRKNHAANRDGSFKFALYLLLVLHHQSFSVYTYWPYHFVMLCKLLLYRMYMEKTLHEAMFLIMKAQQDKCRVMYGGNLYCNYELFHSCETVICDSHIYGGNMCCNYELFHSCENVIYSLI